jgi:hypothetical protein
MSESGDLERAAEGSIMNKSRTKAASTGQTNEGEGSRSAARRYNAGVAKTLHEGHVDEKARDAARALDGAEGPELRRAEERAKHAAEKPAVDPKRSAKH